MNRKRGNLGFTLMEVLVSMAILGIALTLILELFSGGLRSAKISEEYTKAIWYGKATLPVDLYQIVVRVTWPSGSGQRSYEVESLRVFKSEDDTGEKT